MDLGHRKTTLCCWWTAVGAPARSLPSAAHAHRGDRARDQHHWTSRRVKCRDGVFGPNSRQLARTDAPLAVVASWCAAWAAFESALAPPEKAIEEITLLGAPLQPSTST